ncbi:hypothetical protein HDU76_000438 [Blyttiomyces sp. JEL0837]|nr:hypothetical protein HDU76_000438 [Blyttiomyces sp. JEL0837]
MSKRLYIGKLPRDATERDVRRLFDEFGRLRDVRVLVGFAFVEYEDSRDARDAIDKLDNTRFLGERIIVEPAREQSDSRRSGRSDRYEPRARSSKYRLVIDNLPSRTSWQNLKDLMRKAGEVTFTDVDRDGIGYVEFSNSTDMEEAIKMFDDKDYEGKILRVREDREKERDSGSRRDRDRRDDDRESRRDRDRGGRDRGDRRRDDDDDDRDRDEDRREGRDKEEDVRDRDRDRSGRDRSLSPDARKSLSQQLDSERLQQSQQRQLRALEHRHQTEIDELKILFYNAFDPDVRFLPASSKTINSMSMPISYPLANLLERNGVYVLNMKATEEVSVDDEVQKDLTPAHRELRLGIEGLEGKRDGNKKTNRSDLTLNEINNYYRIEYTALRRRHDNEKMDMCIQHVKEKLQSLQPQSRPQSSQPHSRAHVSAEEELAWSYMVWEGYIIDKSVHTELGPVQIFSQEPFSRDVFGEYINVKGTSSRTSTWDHFRNSAHKPSQKTFIVKVKPGSDIKVFDGIFHYLSKLHSNKKFMGAHPSSDPDLKIDFFPMTVVERLPNTQSKHLDIAMNQPAHSFLALMQSEKLFTKPEKRFYRLNENAFFNFQTVFDYLPGNHANGQWSSNRHNERKSSIPTDEELYIQRLILYQEAAQRLEVLSQNACLSASSSELKEVWSRCNHLSSQLQSMTATLGESKMNELDQVAYTSLKARQAVQGLPMKWLKVVTFAAPNNKNNNPITTNQPTPASTSSQTSNSEKPKRMDPRLSRLNNEK